MKRIVISFLLILSFNITFWAQQKVHVVMRGETFATIAKKYGLTEAELRDANATMKVAHTGAKLKIPSKNAVFDVSAPTQPQQNRTSNNSQTTLNNTSQIQQNQQIPKKATFQVILSGDVFEGLLGIFSTPSSSPLVDFKDKEVRVDVEFDTSVPKLHIYYGNREIEMISTSSGLIWNIEKKHLESIGYPYSLRVKATDPKPYVEVIQCDDQYKIRHLWELRPTSGAGNKWLDVMLANAYNTMYISENMGRNLNGGEKLTQRLDDFCRTFPQIARTYGETVRRHTADEMNQLLTYIQPTKTQNTQTTTRQPATTTQPATSSLATPTGATNTNVNERTLNDLLNYCYGCLDKTTTAQEAEKLMRSKFGHGDLKVKYYNLQKEVSNYEMQLTRTAGYTYTYKKHPIDRHTVEFKRLPDGHRFIAEYETIDFFFNTSSEATRFLNALVADLKSKGVRMQRFYAFPGPSYSCLTANGFSTIVARMQSDKDNDYDEWKQYGKYKVFLYFGRK